VLRVRGDGKTYRLALRLSDDFDGDVYQSSFATQAGEWREIELPFAAFVPTFRGRKIPGAPPLDPAHIRSVGFLIADKQVGKFALEITLIAVR
jgi:hypothetical protein